MLRQGQGSVPYLALRVLPVDIQVDLPSILRLLAILQPLSEANDKAALPAPHGLGAPQELLLATVPPLATIGCGASRRVRRRRACLRRFPGAPRRAFLSFMQNGGGGGGGGGGSPAARAYRRQRGRDRRRRIGGGGGGGEAAMVAEGGVGGGGGGGGGGDGSGGAGGGRSNGPVGLRGALGQVVANMASVQRAPVRINCFAVEDAIESKRCVHCCASSATPLSMTLPFLPFLFFSFLNPFLHSRALIASTLRASLPFHE